MPRRREYEAKSLRYGMGAFTCAQADVIRNELKCLLNRVVASRPHELGTRDLVEAFIPIHLREKSLDYARHFRMHYGDGRFEVPLRGLRKGIDGVLTVWHPTDIFTLPTGKLSLQPDPTSGREKLLSWLDWRIEVARQWGLAFAVFQHLANSCSDPKQVRFFWPAIIPLCERELPKLAEKLRRSKAPDVIPSLTKTMREACKAVEVTVLGATFLPAEIVKASNDLPVRLDAAFNAVFESFPAASSNKSEELEFELM